MKHISQKLKLFFSIRNLLFIFLLLKSIVVLSLIQPKRAFAVDDLDPSKSVTISKLTDDRSQDRISRKKYMQTVCEYNKSIQKYKCLKLVFNENKSEMNSGFEKMDKVFAKFWNSEKNIPGIILKNDGKLKQLLATKMTNYRSLELAEKGPAKLIPYPFTNDEKNIYHIVPETNPSFFTKKTCNGVINNKKKIDTTFGELKNLNNDVVVFIEKQKEIIQIANYVWEGEEIMRNIASSEKEKKTEQNIESSQKRKRDEQNIESFQKRRRGD